MTVVVAERVVSAPKIGTLNEKPLHAALKDFCARPGDRREVDVDGFLVDLVRGDELIEVQTRNFTSIRDKLRTLSARHRVRLVYPIAQEKWIVRLAADSPAVLGRRRSPKRGSVYDLFDELVHASTLLANERFSLEVLLIREEEVRRKDGTCRAWRRKGWVVQERRLIEVVSCHVVAAPSDLAALIPAGIAEPFTTADLADAAGIPRPIARRMAYCLRKMDTIRQVGKQGNARLYRRL